jgi:hypothetical protein
MFEDQKVELLPERTPLQSALLSNVGNVSVALALNVGNINLFGHQANAAVAAALAGAKIG